MRVQRVERQATAKRMREAGATFKEIGAALGVSPSRAAQIHEKATAVRAEPLYIKEIADMPLNERLLYPCEKLELSVRSANSLRNMGIENIGQLVQKTPSQLLEAPNFGQKSVDEIRHVLLELGLNLGSPPKN